MTGTLRGEVKIESIIRGGSQLKFRPGKKKRGGEWTGRGILGKGTRFSQWGGKMRGRILSIVFYIKSAGKREGKPIHK